MRIIALLFVAACVMATSVQAQDGQSVVVSHDHNSLVANGHYGGSYAGANVWGCCEDDVSHCFDAWSTYCADRKPRGTCRLGLGCGGGACGCNSQCGIFQNQPCSCGPKFSFKRKHRAPACVSCEEPCETCDETGCDTEGCDTGDMVHDPPVDAAQDVPEEMPQSPVDSARYQGNPLMAPGADAVVKPPVAPKDNASAGRWYLPYKWKK